jgi:hypothetical protein
MAAPITRATDPNGTLTLDESVLAEIEALRAAGELGDGYRTEPRCHICCEVESQELVNKLIAAGLTNREITESCDGVNARRREKGDDRLIDARKVWSHRRNHFNIDDPAMETVRKILERRAAERNMDHVNGVGHAVTPYAVMEVGMVKGFADLAKEDTHLTPKETLEFAKTLHEFTNRDAGQRQMADLLNTMERIITAAEKFVPIENREAFLAEVEGREYKPMQVLTERVHQQAERVERAIKEFTPPRKMDEGDDI